MEKTQDIVIVGAGIASLTISLGLHKLGIQSLVLESSESLRVSGFALATFTNVWKALDVVGVGDYLHLKHSLLNELVVVSTITGKSGAEISFKAKGKNGEHEFYCVKRKLLLKALSHQLPNDTVKYSSKVIFIEEFGYYKLIHLADGTIIKTKALIGCDGVNSMVAKWLGFEQPVHTQRSAVRGYANFKGSHDYGPKFLQFFGNGFRSDEMQEDNPASIKQFVLSKLENKANDHLRIVVETTELDNIICSPLRYRYPWELLWGNISKGNVCVAGDALHPMTLDIGQGGCSALEDGVVLARCLGEALMKEKIMSLETDEEKEKEEYKRIEIGLKKYAKKRRWRSFELISTAYVVGFIQQSSRKILNFLRDKILVKFLAGQLLKISDFDYGKLKIS